MPHDFVGHHKRVPARAATINLQVVHIPQYIVRQSFRDPHTMLQSVMYSIFFDTPESASNEAVILGCRGALSRKINLFPLG
jgi:hypothetical protein